MWQLALFLIRFALCTISVIIVRLYLFPTWLLVPFLRSAHPVIAEEALWAIAQHGTRSRTTIEVIISQLLSEHEAVRRQAAEAVQAIGPAAGKASDHILSVLTVLAKKPDSLREVMSLCEAVRHVEDSDLQLAPRLLELAPTLGSPASSFLVEAAQRMLDRIEEEGEIADRDLELILIRAPAALMAERPDNGWGFAWFGTLRKLAMRFVRRVDSGLVGPERLQIIADELTLLLLQSSSGRVRDQVGRILSIIARKA